MTSLRWLTGTPEGAASVDRSQRSMGQRQLVSGHSEFASKACPCFSAKEWYWLKVFGAGDEIRTHDIFVGNEVLYHWATPALWWLEIFISESSCKQKINRPVLFIFILPRCASTTHSNFAVSNVNDLCSNNALGSALDAKRSLLKLVNC